MGLFHLGDQLFFASAFLTGANHDCRSVRVVGTHENAPVPHQFLEPHPDVGLDVFDQVPDMNVPVGVGQGRGDEDFAFRHFNSFARTLFGTQNLAEVLREE
jgi:hypothetical protein